MLNKATQIAARVDQAAEFLSRYTVVFSRQRKIEAGAKGLISY